MRDERKSASGHRPSASADAARRELLARIEAMTPKERVLLALRLGRRAALLAAAGRKS